MTDLTDLFSFLIPFFHYLVSYKKTLGLNSEDKQINPNNVDIMLPPQRGCKRRKKRAQNTRTHASSWLDDPCQVLDYDFGQDPSSDCDSRKDPPLDPNSDKDQWSDPIQSYI